MEVLVLTVVALAIIGAVVLALILLPAAAAERPATSRPLPQVDLRTLVGHLNARTRRDLEAAAGLTLSRTHYDLEVEHWLLQMVDNAGDELTRALERCGVASPQLTSELSARLARLKTGNKRPPSMSADLVHWIDSAWACAVNEFGSLEVNTCNLLYALLKDPQFQTYRQALPSLGRADYQTLRPLVPVVSQEAPPESLASEGNPPADTAAGGGLRALVAQLSPTARQTLEAAAGMTLAQGHFNIEIEHWLLAILRAPDQEVARALEYFDVVLANLDEELRSVASRFPTGNARPPALSDNLVRLLEVASERAEADFSSSEINQAHLLYALVQDPAFAWQRERVRTLQMISADRLRAFLQMPEGHDPADRSAL